MALFGAHHRSRTCIHFVRSEALYPVKLDGHKIWWLWKESNLHMAKPISVLQTGALPIGRHNQGQGNLKY